VRGGLKPQYATDRGSLSGDARLTARIADWPATPAGGRRRLLWRS
jgi:hypothetical protein